MTEQEQVALPGFWREPLPDPEAVGEDAELAAAIREEIRERGPITFARFMERALYEPGHGYYRRPEAGPGMAGADFLTAPEAHPIFGAAVGRVVEQAWEALGRPAPFTITEPGAGSGALAAGLLGSLRDLGSPLAEVARYRPVEIEEARPDAIRARLDGLGLAGMLAGGPADGVEAGVVVANEVLDALPVHRVVGRSGEVRELLVGLAADGGFAPVEAGPTTPELAARLAADGVVLAEGQVTEICLAIEPWLRTATAHLERGVVVLVDYTQEPAELHGPGRPDGTLRTFARHAVGGDPLRHIGRQDLTATVDLAAVRAAAASVGLEALGETSQAELIARVGTTDLVNAYLTRPGATVQDAFTLRSALLRLLDPRGMGGFRVLAFGRGLPPGTRLPAMERLLTPGR